VRKQDGDSGNVVVDRKLTCEGSLVRCLMKNCSVLPSPKVGLHWDTSVVPSPSLLSSGEVGGRDFGL